ncbi:MAG: class flavin-dependent oxidoreductase [Nocardia sp.]|uniref:LLM class flavin-dependent oxidoreductase n=1 Tax=Nocardia sp. TaxID=1821 RepID=UPI002601D51F|nr:LLM class flavin-dependent oxidoreductase [Nocardia sp.]MCU1641929.1 class flavin-dependent oxidoreductase [Nocardia sp.]
MKISCLILPIHPWREAAEVWRRAEQLGFHAAYTYDHLAFEGFADGPWYGAVPTLAAAATATEKLRLGTMITSPNFRHPALLAKDLMTLDEISGGRITAGIGAGSSGLDASALGHTPWPASERSSRFAEFVTLLDLLLTQPSTTFRGEYYSADDIRMIPGCRQQPRVPFTIAASGPRGMRVAAEHGDGWVTCPFGDDAKAVAPLIDSQLRALAKTCAESGRDASAMERTYLSGFTPENPLASVAAFTEIAGHYTELGITELIVHWPEPGTAFDNDPALFERIATEAIPVR